MSLSKLKQCNRILQYRSFNHILTNAKLRTQTFGLYPTKERNTSRQKYPEKPSKLIKFIHYKIKTNNTRRLEIFLKKRRIKLEFLSTSIKSTSSSALFRKIRRELAVLAFVSLEHVAHRPRPSSLAASIHDQENEKL
ncbi:hypothetical protein V8G54_011906 [Vigna mungo]|uniref:Uncharacterized protein n=1 Tax=Vigna mungo TaxID=3915 RepID=A0AAQ3NQ26_VIGMU